MNIRKHHKLRPDDILLKCSDKTHFPELTPLLFEIFGLVAGLLIASLQFACETNLNV